MPSLRKPYALSFGVIQSKSVSWVNLLLQVNRRFSSNNLSLVHMEILLLLLLFARPLFTEKIISSYLLAFSLFFICSFHLSLELTLLEAGWTSPKAINTNNVNNN